MLPDPSRIQTFLLSLVASMLWQQGSCRISKAKSEGALQFLPCSLKTLSVEALRHHVKSDYPAGKTVEGTWRVAGEVERPN